MPRVLKRRSDVIDDDAEESSASPRPPRGRRRSTTPSSSGSEASSASQEPTQAHTGSSSLQILIKKLVRLALSTEYSRTPLRRQDISTKILADSQHSRNFKAIFEGAQSVLRSTFGMQLVELPGREKLSLKDRRNNATQKATNTKSRGAGVGTLSQAANSTVPSSATKSWILVSTLPPAYKHHPQVLAPARAASQSTESTYTALYTFVLALIFLNAGSLPETKLERYLKRVDLETYTPLEMATERLMQRMVRESYVERRKDTSSGEEVVEYVAGPRGKVEVGKNGVAGLVKAVYGFMGTKADRPQLRPADAGGEAEPQGDYEGELDAKLKRSLGVEDLGFVGGHGTAGGDNVNGIDDEQQDLEPMPAPTQRREGRSRRHAPDVEDDDDDE